MLDPLFNFKSSLSLNVIPEIAFKTLTEILIFFPFFKLAVIVAEPGEIALTLPLTTVATLSSLVAQVIFVSSLVVFSSGTIVVLIVLLSPGYKLS